MPGITGSSPFGLYAVPVPPAVLAIHPPPPPQPRGESSPRDLRNYAQVHDEYCIVNENIRHYGKMRFTIFNIFLLINAGLFAGISFLVSASTASTGGGGALPLLHDVVPYLPAAISLLGVLAVLYIVNLEQLLRQYIDRFQARAMELEDRLGYSHWLRRPTARGMHSLCFVYSIVGVTWLGLAALALAAGGT
jgi:hypothetical protein